MEEAPALVLEVQRMQLIYENAIKPKKTHENGLEICF